LGCWNDWLGFSPN